MGISVNNELYTIPRGNTKVVIAHHEFPYTWDGVYYFALSDYPKITAWELKKLTQYVAYEKAHGRQSEIVCENVETTRAVERALARPETVADALLPEKITECKATACKHKGCFTDLLCHTTDVESAKSIFTGGGIFSAVAATGKTASELAGLPRNVVNDPPDYFDYVMFSWGNCQAGDRIVLERRLNRFPEDADVGPGFSPGVRFLFRYRDIAAHPGCVFDGCHPAKVKDGLALAGNLLACVVPKVYENEIRGCVPRTLADKVFYLWQDEEDIWQWAEKVYEYIHYYRFSG